MHDIYTLIWSDQVAKLSPEAVIVYLLLRCDVSLNKTTTAKMLKSESELTSGMDVQLIAQKSGQPEATVRRVIEELVKVEWIKPRKVALGDYAYQLGLIDNFNATWFAEVEPDEAVPESSVVGRIRAMISEGEKRKKTRPKSRLSQESKRALATEAGLITRERKATSVVLDVFKQRYKDKFHENYPMDVGDGSDSSRRSAYGKVYAMLSRFVTFCDESTELACEIVHLLIDEWEKVSGVLGLLGRPTVNILGTAAIVRKLKGYRLEGIPEARKMDRTDVSGLATRASASYDESKDVGW